jgi:hypothetical protein
MDNGILYIYNFVDVYDMVDIYVDKYININGINLYW